MSFEEDMVYTIIKNTLFIKFIYKQNTSIHNHIDGHRQYYSKRYKLEKKEIDSMS